MSRAVVVGDECVVFGGPFDQTPIRSRVAREVSAGTFMLENGHGPYAAARLILADDFDRRVSKRPPHPSWCVRYWSGSVCNCGWNLGADE